MLILKTAIAVFKIWKREQRLDRCHTCNFIAQLCRAILSHDKIASVTLACRATTATLSRDEVARNKKSRDKIAGID